MPDFDFDFVHLYGNKTFNVNRGRSSGGLSIYYKKHLSKYIEFVGKNPKRNNMDTVKQRHVYI